MRWTLVRDGLGALNYAGVRLAMRDRELARSYLSRCVQLYDELAGRGLPSKDPLEHIAARGWTGDSGNEPLLIPSRLHDGGGTRLDELLYLAAVTRALRPKKIFEIGTFKGRTTSVLILNAGSDTQVITLDLPPAKVLDDAERQRYIDTDVVLTKTRKLESYVHDLRLEDRCSQIHCDSMQFDARPHAASVELGFIDGAHGLAHVDNDTRKMALMMADRGLVLWHDYGGKGKFRDLTEYLERLGRRIPIYRVPGTSLAWAEGAALRDQLA